MPLGLDLLPARHGSDSCALKVLTSTTYLGSWIVLLSRMMTLKATRSMPLSWVLVSFKLTSASTNHFLVLCVITLATLFKIALSFRTLLGCKKLMVNSGPISIGAAMLPTS